jgi:glutaredoxin
MSRIILFSLENCVKCMQIKELIAGRDDVEIVTFPHDLNEWSEDEVQLAKSYNVFDDLQVTAPILWVNGEKKIGYLRIKKWIEDSRKKTS